MGRIASLFVPTLLVLALLVRMGPGIANLSAQAVETLAIASICHTDAADRAPGDTDPAGPHDCTLCPICLTASFSPPTAAPADAPSALLAVRPPPIATPPSTGPPAPGNHASRPRAPPV